MATIEQRLSALEREINTAPWLVLDVTDRPTPEQQGEIDRAIKTGRMCIVFYEPGQTAWLAGSGKPAPWEKQEKGEYGNA